MPHNPDTKPTDQLMTTKRIQTVHELAIAFLESNHLNKDIHLDDEMPRLAHGRNGLTEFIREIDNRYLPSLSNALKLTHRSEVRAKKNKKPASAKEAAAITQIKPIVDDLKLVIANNKGKLNSIAKVGAEKYRGNETSYFDLVVTFYDQLLNPELTNTIIPYQRAKTLANQEDFFLSPMMREIIQSRESALKTK